ncbi:MAG: histidine kinase N-terminal 7TM domain-containing protein, partial [Bacillota bacterium]|nr:histidine kinase N-terminal 7TM domain-containing protein [Bacillota bacterium]
MSFGTYTSILILALSVLISAVLIVYSVIKGKKTSIFYSFLCCQILLLNWSLGMIIEIFSTDRTVKWIIVCVEYFSISFIGVSWILFSFFYTEKRYPKKVLKVLPLFISPVVSYLMLLTNNYHHYFYIRFEQDFRIYGIFFWVNVIQSYVYIFTANIIMIRYSLKQPNYRKEQAFLISLTSIIPIISNFLYVFKIVKMDFDLTPVSFSISIYFLTVAVFKYRFLDIVSNALVNVFDNMKEAIIIINNLNKIMEFNRAFKLIFGEAELIANEDVGKFYIYLRKRLTECDDKLIKVIMEGTNYIENGEIVLDRNEYYAVNVQPIFDSRRRLLGRVITFNDISVYKKLMENLDSKNRELFLKNKALKEHLTTAAELAAERERNRIAQEVHDTLGHTMTMLIALLEVCKITYKRDLLVTEEKLNEAIEAARDGLKELRQSLARIRSEQMRTENFINTLDNLISGFELTGMKVELTADKLDNVLTSNQADVIYRVCKEALTNSLRHGKAEHVSII